MGTCKHFTRLHTMCHFHVDLATQGPDVICENTRMGDLGTFRHACSWILRYDLTGMASDWKDNEWSRLSVYAGEIVEFEAQIG